MLPTILKEQGPSLLQQLPKKTEITPPTGIRTNGELPSKESGLNLFDCEYLNTNFGGSRRELQLLLVLV